MTRVYPDRTPFPHQAALTIDGVGEQAGTTESMRAASFPTLLLPPIKQLRKMIEDYLRQYSPAKKEMGVPVAMSGEHGTGKTHSIYYIMSLVASGELRPASGVLQPYQIYIRAETGDFMEIYRQLMRQVPLTVLRDLTFRFLGVVGSEIYSKSMASERVEERAAQVAIQDPEIVSRAFREYLVGESEAKYRQAAEIQTVFGKEENFHKVIGYLLRDDLAETAYRWLLGEEVSEEHRKKLGVTGTINTPMIARWGIRFLATVFGRGGRPLIIYVDQYEKLLLTLNGETIADNAGLMRALVDEIKKESGMIIFSGNTEAWKAVSRVPDLRQRFGTNVINFPILSYDDASKLISLYLSLGKNHLLEIWSLEGIGAPIRLRGHALPIRAVAVSQDGRLAVSASKDSTIKIWDIESQDNIRTLHGHQGAVNAVALTPDQSQRLVSGSDDQTVRVWDLESGKELHTMAGHESWVNSVVVTPDGSLACSGSSDLTIRVWDLESGKEIQVLRGHRDTIWSLAITPDGKTLVSASSDGTLRVWDLVKRGEPRKLLGHNTWVNAVIITLDGRRIISASDDTTLRIWDTETGEAIFTLSGHLAPVRALAILPDGGGRIISAATDNTFNVWDLNRGELITSIHHPTGDMCVFTPLPRDARRLISARLEEFQVGDDDGIYPFEPDVLRIMLANGGGNVRRLLQMCADAFELALPEQKPIDGALMKDVLNKDKRITVDSKWVRREIERLISERSLPFSRSYKVGKTPVDFAVLTPDDKPRLLIQISEALFHKDEAEKALLSVNLVDQVRHYDLQAQVVLVVVGYASPEVTDLLRGVAHEAIIYEPDNFTSKFGEVLDPLKKSLSVGSSPELDIDTLKGDLLKEVKKSIEGIAAVRGHETARLEEQLKKFFDRQTFERLEMRREDTRVLWSEERKKIEERITEVRKNQKKTDLEELERLRKQAVDEKKQKMLIKSLLFGFSGFLFGFVFMAAVLTCYVKTGFWGIDPKYLIENLTQSLLFGLLIATIFASIGAFIIFRIPKLQRELESEVFSIEELDRITKAYNSQTKLNQPGGRFLLRDSNPHVRYAGAGVLALDPKTTEIDLIKALWAERSTLVRRQIARQLGSFRIDLGLIFEKTSFKTTPELAYLVEVAVKKRNSTILQLTDQPQVLHTLAMISVKDEDFAHEIYYAYNKTNYRNKSLAFELSASKFSFPSSKRAFKSDLSGDLSYLSKISDSDIQSALRELSPFEEGGLGTFDDLESIARIDEYYLFLRQIAFYKERGLSAPLLTDDVDE